MSSSLSIQTSLQDVDSGGWWFDGWSNIHTAFHTCPFGGGLLWDKILGHMVLVRLQRRQFGFAKTAPPRLGSWRYVFSWCCLFDLDFWGSSGSIPLRCHCVCRCWKICFREMWVISGKILSCWFKEIYGRHQRIKWCSLCSPPWCFKFGFSSLFYQLCFQI